MQDIRQLFEDVDARLVGQSQRPHDPPPVEPGKIVDFLFEQLLVGKNDLLAGECADARRFQADLLDRALHRVDPDCVALAERAVEQDGKRGEQVGKDALRRQTDGNAADAEPCDEAGNVHAEIGENENHRNRKQDDGDEQADDAERTRPTDMAIVAGRPVFDEAQDDFAREHRRLQSDGNDKQEINGFCQILWRMGVSGNDLKRDGGDEPEPGFGQCAADDTGQVRMRVMFARKAAADPFCTEQDRYDNCGNDQADDDLDRVLCYPGDAVGPERVKAHVKTGRRSLRSV